MPLSELRHESSLSRYHVMYPEQVWRGFLRSYVRYLLPPLDPIIFRSAKTSTIGHSRLTALNGLDSFQSCVC